MKTTIEAIQVAESFNIKKFRADFHSEVHSGTNSEVFYDLGNNRYLYLFDYGVIVLANYDVISKSEFISFIKKYAIIPIDLDLFEEYEIKTEENIERPLVKNNFVTVSKV